MFKTINIIGIAIFFILGLFSLGFSEESMTITTYYPSPYGSYNELTTTGNTYLAMTSGSKVGIGGLDPNGAYKLYVKTSSQGIGVELPDHNQAGIATVNSVVGSYMGVLNVGAPAAFIGTFTNHPLYLQTNYQTRLTITPDGKVGIGASPGNYKLFVKASGLGIGVEVPDNNSGGIVTTNSTVGAFMGTLGTTNGVARVGTFTNHPLQLETGYIPRVTISTTGNVGIGTANPGYTLTVSGTTWCTSGAWAGSDLRWKRNVETLKNPLHKLLGLRGVEYNWKREEFKGNNFPEGRQIGIIAQELEKEFPELVTTDKDGYKAIAYDRFTAVLLEAIKAQQKEIEGLKQEMIRLKEK